MQEPIGGDQTTHVQVRVVKRRRSMWEDRAVRSMAFWVASLLIILLVTIVSALYFGLVGGDSAPQTALKRELVAWESVTRSLDAAATADQWQSFVLALISDSQYQRAQRVIDQVNAKSKVDQSRGANMLYCTAVLQSARGRDDDALDTFSQVMELTMTAYEEELARGEDSSKNWAMSSGLHENYHYSTLDRARILRKQERWGEALKMLDLYLDAHPRAAGVFVDRAFLKVKSGDVAGAESDYRAALRFVPGFPEALEGLQGIGAGE